MSSNSSARNEGNASSSTTGKCPVDHKNPSSLWKVFGAKNDDVTNSSATSSTASSATDQNRQSSIPASLEEAARYAQTPQRNQRLPLSTYRLESTIPRGSSSTDENNNNNIPHHQLGSKSSKWVYPSEQQVFNAMKRKGWEGIEEEAIPSFLQVHNSVNERSWMELCKWENNNNNENHIELVRFEGRPKDISPKAWLLSTFLFQEKPFDRHDWYIDNGINHEKRYVLDFYMKEDHRRAGVPRVDIDVRPALDTPQAFIQRGTRIIKEMFPGITKEIEKLQSTSRRQ